jgi:hypothetical protein
VPPMHERLRGRRAQHGALTSQKSAGAGSAGR